MLFELNENPKVIQQLLGHRDVKTTITVYNNVNSDYIKESTNRLNDKLNENEALRKQNNLMNARQEEKQKEIQEQTSDLSDDELDQVLEDLLRQREARKRKRERDFEM